jgi:hypothetical protein
METKKQNPFVKRNLIQARVDNDDMKVIIEKAFVYCGGDLSKFVRMACLNFKSVTKVKAGK